MHRAGLLLTYIILRRLSGSRFVDSNPLLSIRSENNGGEKGSGKTLLRMEIRHFFLQQERFNPSFFQRNPFSCRAFIQFIRVCEYGFRINKKKKERIVITLINRDMQLSLKTLAIPNEPALLWNHTQMII